MSARTLLGVFTPWATIVCLPCNNAAADAAQPDERGMLVGVNQSRRFDYDDATTDAPANSECDRCHQPTHCEREDAALCQHIAVLVGDPDFTLSQTGGMCSAAQADIGRKELLVTQAEYSNSEYRVVHDDDGSWSMYSPDNGQRPRLLLTGTAQWVEDEEKWTRPNDADFNRAEANLVTVGLFDLDPDGCCMQDEGDLETFEGTVEEAVPVIREMLARMRALAQEVK